ncbi:MULTISPECIES: S8 family peptidase [Clostridium]|uniref:S8 family peptidase n=1 Tax=Clostridium aquiflavi TaxID=3073603 RepID=A0ABU1EHQ2_9CLOT|nr:MULTISPECIES: S8 family peptidase [unclassified Clostridium]MDR5587788.1 S8 family peptidase [Clostridium sp. 5N-1]NFG62722.1 peptidase S8 [Clostridium botulinum]NFQ10838.1 peptidase S8 [Clostridium botulinum]
MKRQFNIPRNIFNDTNNDNYIIQYQGDIMGEISKEPNYYVLLINDKYAIISVPKDTELTDILSKFPSIVYVKPAEMYTLQSISPLEASQANFLQIDLPLNLTGKGVNIGIIDTGIDYLCEEFMDSNGKTRIECIWDQTINNDTDSDRIPFGSIYLKDKIDEAIKASINGKSPYEIVPTKDDIGHGTNMAGLIGGTGKNPNLKGVVPSSDFVVVKLVEDYSFKEQFNVNIPVFNITSIFAALEFLYKYSLRVSKPIVIYLPLGSNLGSHTGNDILEKYLETLSSNSGIAVVTGTGNERNKKNHTSNVLSYTNYIKAIEMDVSPEEKNLWVEIWTESPNVVSLDIVSPSGENTGTMPPLINSTELYTFIFEKTSIKVNYYLPEEFTGDELIRIRFYNIQPGLWKLRLIGNYILDGKVNAWMPQEGIKHKDTGFSWADPYGTITNPGTSEYLITAAAYNQNNNNMVDYSGVAFMENFQNKIDVVAGGVNALTVAPNNQTAIVNGTSVSAAILAGTCAMLFEWGIINGNYPYMYSQSIKTFLARGTTKRIGDIYPNPQWGYGILNIVTMFQNMT